MRVPWTRAVLVVLALAAGIALAYALGRVQPPSAGGAGQAPPPPGVSAEFRYRRIICMSPATAEITFAIGAGARVVGVSEHTVWPPAATKLPICGGFFNPSYERILSLRPDLIISQGEATDLRRFVDNNGIKLELVPVSTLDAILTDTEQLGRLLQVEPQAKRVADDMRRRLDGVRARVRGEPVVRVLLVTGHDPGALTNIYAVGPHTFLSDVVEVAGGRNVFSDLPVDYGVVSREAILERRPDVIVELRGMTVAESREQGDVRRLWSVFATLPAVKNGRVYAVDANYALIPGPRVVDLAEKLADLFHPGSG